LNNFSFGEKNSVGLLTRNKVDKIDEIVEKKFPSVEMNKLFFNFEQKAHKNFTTLKDIDLANYTQQDFSNQAFSKFKMNFTSNHQQIRSLVQQKIFQNENELYAYTNRNIKIFYSDRFFIYPNNQISVNYNNYYKIKYVNITSQISKVESLSYDPNAIKNSILLKRYDNQDLTQQRMSEIQLISESREKFEKLIKEYQIKLEKLNEEMITANIGYEDLINKSNGLEQQKEVQINYSILFYLNLFYRIF
jgi:hypothetical protein